MKKNRKVSEVFYNNKFLVVFSIVLAVVIWLIVAVEFSPETTNVIKNVPVQIDYTNSKKLGLAPFGETKFTVDVTVSGKKYIVESDDIVDDVVVAANTGYVNSAGTYSLKLDASSKSARPLYSIAGASTDEIDVYFDYPKEKDFIVEPEVRFAENAVPEGYCKGEYIFPETDKVAVYGPATEVNKISKVVARATVDGELRRSKTFDAALAALTQEGSTPRHIDFSRKSAIIPITVPVYKIAKLRVECNFTSKPSDYIEKLPFTVDISPPFAKFGVPEGKLEGMNAFEIASIDFSRINVGKNTFRIKAEDISGGTVLDEDIKEFVVTVNAEGMASKTIPAPSTVIFINIPSGAKAELAKLNFDKIAIIGPQASLDEADSQNITLSVDLNAADKNASGEVTAPVTITDAERWSFGEYYATVKITR